MMKRYKRGPNPTHDQREPEGIEIPHEDDASPPVYALEAIARLTPGDLASIGGHLVRVVAVHVAADAESVELLGAIRFTRLGSQGRYPDARARVCQGRICRLCTEPEACDHATDCRACESVAPGQLAGMVERG